LSQTATLEATSSGTGRAARPTGPRSPKRGHLICSFV
jgi:hypothetical protein